MSDSIKFLSRVHTSVNFQNGNTVISVRLKCLRSKKGTELCQERWFCSIKASLFKNNYYEIQWIMKNLLLSWCHLSIFFNFLLQWDPPHYYFWVNPEMGSCRRLGNFSTYSFHSNSKLPEFRQWANQNMKWSSVSWYTFKNLSRLTIV